MPIKTLPILLMFCAVAFNMLAQDDEKEKPRAFGINKLLITGHADMTAVFDTGQANFGDVGFSGIFLYKLSDKLFAECELEISTGEGSVEVGLEHANLV